MEYLIHISSDGDRWDTLASRYYGDATLYASIIAANPHLAITPSIPSGQQVAIPILEESNSLSSEDLPPWKR
jgi:phage tail protein X